MKNIIQFVDHTSLSECDTPATIEAFVKRALATEPRPASVCLFPSMVEAAALTVGDDDLAITAVCGGFPSGQTYIEVKMLEVAMALENGADEIDIVANIGALMEGDFALAKSEIETIRNEIGDDAILKVIIESGTLGDDERIYRAAMAAIEGGADFVKTSTGKSAVGATPDAVRTICRAIRDSGKRVGVKVSGGIASIEAAKQYYMIVEQELGQDWMTPDLFRIGTSRMI